LVRQRGNVSSPGPEPDEEWDLISLESRRVPRIVVARLRRGTDVEDAMDFAASGAHDFSSGAPQVNDRPTDPPSPEEGRRLIQELLRIEREDLRREIFTFVAEMLRIQESNRQQTH
jgi:hypothetical protein